MAGKNYKKIITELFQTYNPKKVGEVDALLKKFAGREEELIEKIHLKYGGAAAETKKRGKTERIILLIVALAVLGSGAWYAADSGLFAGGESNDGVVGEEKKKEIVEEGEKIELQEKEMMRTPYSAPPIEYGVQVGLFSTATNQKILDRLGDNQLELNVLPTENDNYMYARVIS